MRNLFGLALSAVVLASVGSPAKAQVPYGPPVRVYPFRSESILSVNNSYLGYGNLSYVGPNPPAPGYITRYGLARNQGYLVSASQVPPPPRYPRPRVFRRWRANRN